MSPVPTSRNSCCGIRQAGTPEVVATGGYDARTRTYRLEVTQTVPPTPGQPVKEPMVIPLAIGLVGRDGHDLPLKLERRTDDRARRAHLDQARADVRVRRYRRTAGAVAQSWIFSARSSSSPTFPPTI